MKLRFTSQQDNYLKHTAEAKLRWFKKQVYVWECFNQSPDLNPPENLWIDLKIVQHKNMPSLKELLGHEEGRKF